MKNEQADSSDFRLMLLGAVMFSILESCLLTEVREEATP